MLIEVLLDKYWVLVSKFSKGSIFVQMVQKGLQEVWKFTSSLGDKKQNVKKQGPQKSPKWRIECCSLLCSSWKWKFKFSQINYESSIQSLWKQTATSRTTFQFLHYQLHLAYIWVIKITQVRGLFFLSRACADNIMYAIDNWLYKAKWDIEGPTRTSKKYVWFYSRYQTLKLQVFQNAYIPALRLIVTYCSMRAPV